MAKYLEVSISANLDTYDTEESWLDDEGNVFDIDAIREMMDEMMVDYLMDDPDTFWDVNVRWVER